MLLYSIGTPRSGHTGILHWVFNQRQEYANTPCDVVGYTPTGEIRYDKNTIYRYAPTVSSQINGFIDNIHVKDGHNGTPGIQVNEQRMVIFEDHYGKKPLSTIQTIIDKLEQKLQVRIVPILILRDFYNNLASCMKSASHNRFIGDLCTIWPQYAQEVISPIKQLQGCCVILFNKWFSNRRYRQQICERLGLDFTDMGINNISTTGSSFDGYKLHDAPQTSKVLERYLQYIDHQQFKKLANKPEITQLVQEIFDIQNPFTEGP